MKLSIQVAQSSSAPTSLVASAPAETKVSAKPRKLKTEKVKELLSPFEECKKSHGKNHNGEVSLRLYPRWERRLCALREARIEKSYPKNKNEDEPNLFLQWNDCW